MLSTNSLIIVCPSSRENRKSLEKTALNILYVKFFKKAFNLSHEKRSNMGIWFENCLTFICLGDMFCFLFCPVLKASLSCPRSPMSDEVWVGPTQLPLQSFVHRCAPGKNRHLQLQKWSQMFTRPKRANWNSLSQSHLHWGW